MDYDDMQSDREPSPEPNQQGLLDDFEEGGDDWRGRDRSQTPVYDTDPKAKPRKRLVKKGDTGKQPVAPELYDDDEEDNVPRFAREGSEDGDGRKRRKGKEGGNGKKEKRHKFGSSSSGGGKSGSKFKKGFAGKAGKDDDGEVKELWDTIAGGDSEVELLSLPFMVQG